MGIGQQTNNDTEMDRGFYKTLYTVLGLTKSSIDLIEYLRCSPHSIIYSNKHTKENFKEIHPYSESTIKQSFKQLRNTKIIVPMDTKGMYILSEDFFNSNIDHLVECSIVINIKHNGKRSIKIIAKGSTLPDRELCLSQNS